MYTEEQACTPLPADENNFNPAAFIPHDCTIEHIWKAMTEFTDFLGFVNTQLYAKDIPRLEVMLMSANFSSIVGEFMGLEYQSIVQVS